MIHKAHLALLARWRARFDTLPEDSRAALRSALLDLRADCAVKSEYMWHKRKAIMAVYYRTLSVYAGHLARTVRPPSATVARHLDRNRTPPPPAPAPHTTS